MSKTICPLDLEGNSREDSIDGHEMGEFWGCIKCLVQEIAIKEQARIIKLLEKFAIKQMKKDIRECDECRDYRCDGWGHGFLDPDIVIFLIKGEK